MKKLTRTIAFICCPLILASCAVLQATQGRPEIMGHLDKKGNIMNFRPMSINHRGEPFQLPFIVYRATSINVYSLLDYEVASRLCEKENYTPILLKTSEGERKAAGFVSAIDYKKTSAVPYREWTLGIFVISKDKEMPEVSYVNATSLFFQSILNDEKIGHAVFCPKLILDEPLPTEIGYEYYGIPKELGKVTYKYDQQVSEFSVSREQGTWIMKATCPTKRGALTKFGLLWDMFKAYDFTSMLKSMRTSGFEATLVGSVAITPKMAHMKIKKDPNTEMFPWDTHDCKLEINPESKWGKVLLDLRFQPELVVHVPNLKFEFSAPLDQE